MGSSAPSAYWGPTGPGSEGAAASPLGGDRGQPPSSSAPAGCPVSGCPVSSRRSLARRARGSDPPRGDSVTFPASGRWCPQALAQPPLSPGPALRNIVLLINEFELPDKSVSRDDYTALLTRLNATHPARVAGLPLEVCRLQDFLDKVLGRLASQRGNGPGRGRRWAAAHGLLSPVHQGSRPGRAGPRGSGLMGAWVPCHLLAAGR